MAGRRRRSTGRRRGSSRGSSGSRRSSSSRPSRRRTVKPLDPESVLDSVVDEVVRRLGLDLLGLSREDYKEILRPVVAGIVEQYSSRPSRETIVNKLVNLQPHLYVLASAYVLERDKPLTEDAVEFIVSNAPQVAARYVSKLYEAVNRLGRHDLLPLLRSAWERYGHPTPVPCPRCGFRAVTPDLVCMVCGYELDEREVKEAVDFERLLEEFAELYGPGEVREAIERGVVLLGDGVLKPPSAPREPTDIALHLTRRERERLRELVSLRLEVSRGGGSTVT